MLGSGVSSVAYEYWIAVLLGTHIAFECDSEALVIADVQGPEGHCNAGNERLGVIKVGEAYWRCPDTGAFEHEARRILCAEYNQAPLV